MKKHVFLTSYVELADMVAQCELSDDSDQEDKAKKKQKKSLARKASKHLQVKKPETNHMGDLIKNSLGNFFKKKVTDTKDDSTKTPEQLTKEAEEEELSKSERYRRNVAKFVEMAKKGKEERERKQKEEEEAKK